MVRPNLQVSSEANGIPPKIAIEANPPQAVSLRWRPPMPSRAKPSRAMVMPPSGTGVVMLPEKLVVSGEVVFAKVVNVLAGTNWSVITS